MSGGKVVAWLTAQSPFGVKVQPARGERPQHATDLVLQSDLAAAIARAEAAERDAARFAFCVARDVFPVRDNGGVQWVMFVAVTSARRSLFIGDTPAEAIDAAIAAQQAEGEA